MIFSKFAYLFINFIQAFYEKTKVFNILIVLCFIFGCSASHKQAIVSSRQPPPSLKINHHVVAAGETLYSIAWRYGLDYKELAKDNSVERSYKIFPGQIIRLNRPVQPIPQKRVIANPSLIASTVESLNRLNNRQVAAKKVKPVTLPPKKIENKTVTVRSENKSTVKHSHPLKKAVPGKIYWRWPVSGKVLTNFSGKNALTRGIDIGGKKGESVNAASSGEVVYAGGGLRGYGKLVIIKHSNTYLSAYAHNSRLHVKEGEFVNVGQHIADMGSTGIGTNSKPRLHFQIRRNGKPVNPLPLLPKRKL